MRSSLRRRKGDAVPTERMTRKKERELRKAARRERKKAARERNGRPGAGPDSDVATFAAGLGG